MKRPISYAQNAEDVRLARAFGGMTDGFYVEVGAHDPEDLSITKHFYDLGWRGVCIEPAPTAHARIARARPRDICLQLAISDTSGRMPFFESPGSGLSTLDREEADRFVRDGFARDTYMVEVRTLADVCAEHAARPIDFMTIDVEGHEAAVLRGADFSRHRPKVLVVEATRPRTTFATHSEWEGIVLSAGYVFAAFDGVSRFYVAEEHRELVDPVSIPPSALDDFVPLPLHRVEQELRHLRWSPITAVPVFADRLLRKAWRRLRARY